MGLEDLCGIVNSDRDYGTAGLSGDLKTSFMEGKHFQFAFASASGTFGEDTDGYAIFNFLNGSEYGFHPLFNIFPVQKQTVQIFHPVGQKRDGFHFFFCNVAGSVRTEDIGKENIEITPVVPDIQDRLIFWDLFMAQGRNMSSGYFQDQSEYGLDESERTDIFFFSDQIFQLSIRRKEWGWTESDILLQ